MYAHAVLALDGPVLLAHIVKYEVLGTFAPLHIETTRLNMASLLKKTAIGRPPSASGISAMVRRTAHPNGARITRLNFRRDRWTLDSTTTSRCHKTMGM